MLSSYSVKLKSKFTLALTKREFAWLTVTIVAALLRLAGMTLDWLSHG
jgi:hypothetical protein